MSSLVTNHAGPAVFDPVKPQTLIQEVSGDGNKAETVLLDEAEVDSGPTTTPTIGFAVMTNATNDLAEIEKRQRMIEEMNRKKKLLLKETLVMRRMKTSRENATLKQIEVGYSPPYCSLSLSF